jgi:hypothetical protein
LWAIAKRLFRHREDQILRCQRRFINNLHDLAPAVRNELIAWPWLQDRFI